MEIGNKIRNLRAKSGMSQEELAGKVFVSRQTISRAGAPVSSSALLRACWCSCCHEGM